MLEKKKFFCNMSISRSGDRVTFSQNLPQASSALCPWREGQNLKHRLEAVAREDETQRKIQRHKDHRIHDPLVNCDIAIEHGPVMPSRNSGFTQL